MIKTVFGSGLSLLGRSMKNSYLINYIKLYFWQFLAVGLNFVAMLIVLPAISGNAALFGIYSLCMSINIFLAYADIGFISAGMKYAGEYFSQGNIEKEAKVTGFVIFVLVVGILPFIAAMGYFSYDPTVIIKDLAVVESGVASSMFLMLAIFAINIILQKISTIIYGVRVEDYYCRKINIVGHIIKLLSVFYFFSATTYDILGYFFTFHFINFICFGLAIILAKKRYNYPLGMLIKGIKFSREYFDIVEKLAFTSLYSTVAWIIYFELDSMVIGKLSGVEQVAVYAVGLNMLTFTRTIFSMIFAPFVARFNHFVGLKDFEGLKSFYGKVMAMTMPITFFPVASIIFLMNYLVVCWVGEAYQTSIVLGQFLVASFLFSFISYPTAAMLIALEKLRILSIINTILVVVFWMGVVVTYNDYGVNAFAFFKFAATCSTLFVYMYSIVEIRGLNINRYVIPFIVSSTVLGAIIYFGQTILIVEKSVINLLFVVILGFVSSVGAVVTYILLEENFRRELGRILGVLSEKLVAKRKAI